MSERVMNEDQVPLSLIDCMAKSNLEHTIKILKEYIAEKVDFSTIAHEMPCMRAILSKIYHMSPEQTKIEFFKRLEESDDPTKYEDFLKVLHSRYSIVASMIEDGKGMTDYMRENEALINIFMERISTEINPGEISEALQAREIIAPFEGEKARNLCATHSKKGAALYLLFRMHCRKKTWYEEFLVVLYEAGKRRLVAEIDDKIYDKLSERDGSSAEVDGFSITAESTQPHSLTRSTSANGGDSARTKVHPQAFIHSLKRHKSKEPRDEQSFQSIEKGAISGAQAETKATTQREPTLVDVVTLVQCLSTQFSQVINRLDSLEKKVDGIQKTLASRHP